MTRDDRLDILVVSNLWPPPFIGGYELGACDVVSRLERRGHRITVLTSTYGVPRPGRDGNVLRLFHEHVNWRPLPWRALVAETVRSARSIGRVRRAVRAARFDVVYLFNPLGLNAALVQEVCDSGRPVVAYVSDDWVAAWPACDRLFGVWMDRRPYLPGSRRIAFALAKLALKRAKVLTRQPWLLPMRHAQFVSRYIQSISADRTWLGSQEVIPWGIDLTRFRYRERRPEELSHWLFAGQVAEHKGVHTAVEAVKLLRDRGHFVDLTIYGTDNEPFATTLRRRVEQDGLAPHVRFAGACARERLFEEAYDRAGLLVFPTMWEEPFSITLLEAFASGLPVLSTLTGGTGEIVRHGETATVFSVGSAEHLAAQYLTLARHPERAVAMARRAREIVERHLDIERMVDRIETHLIEVAAGRGSGEAEPFQPRPHPWEPADVAPGQPSRGVEPDADDGEWLAALWRDLAVAPSSAGAAPELDSTPELMFPLSRPTSELGNGRFATYLAGVVLEAGAVLPRLDLGGRRVRVDWRRDLAPDVRAQLDRLPFADASFDTVLSVATIERCPRPWAVIGELARVLRPGGHLLVSAPFLAPARPGDYFRFTGEGLGQLALDAGLRVVETATDYSVQHTLAGVLWELLRHHPQHRYLVSDPRVQAWFAQFTQRAGRVVVPSLGEAFCLVARRDA